MKCRLSAAYAAITAAFFLSMAGCSSGSGSEPMPPQDPTIVTASADIEAVTKRWVALSESERHAVCERALQAKGPDFKGMQSVLEDTGISKEDAAEMLPFAANECP